MVQVLDTITVRPSLEAKTLSSKWDGLSPHLIASFYEVAKTGEHTWGRIEGEGGTDPVTVMAPLTEATLEMLLNWQSPFEQTGPESRAPALAAMLQSGSLQPTVDAIKAFFRPGDQPNPPPNVATDMARSDQFLRQFEGRTGITKLNSTQVFNGMPPVKINVVALFRAWSRAAIEVEAPVNKLMEWALPVMLSPDASVLARAVDAIRGTKGYIEALMPSMSPTRIAMRYKGRVYSPLVIESIGMPLSSPVNSDGDFVQLAVPMTLCTLTAIDRGDWRAIGSEKL
ncbi:hypothetical protein [Castellaniella sp.]|uniref:hypothetical protein n=1 Tax=Castellaniella sp. TaxID=1955812 RepID=UPI002AFFE2AB|nr:hypothetical protein [Castellaniella sp.]